MSAATSSWLAQFPLRDHGMVQAWVQHCLRQGSSTPEELLERLRILVMQKQAWSVAPQSRELVQSVLEALRTHPRSALRYAKALLAEGAS